MMVPRLQLPLRAAIASIGRSGSASSLQVSLHEALAGQSIFVDVSKCGSSLQFIRRASHQAQGAVNSAKDGPGKRLGAKKTGDQYVIPGNIIFRQRGTHWFPGENCAMGRDHTIYATESGYVKYYKDPDKNPKRQYIGIVFERDMNLPLPRNSMRRRRLGMEAIKMEEVEKKEVEVNPLPIRKVKERRGEEGRNLTLGPGYMYREANWEIGRAAERARVRVRKFKPGDRWVAWRKSSIRKARKKQNEALGKKKKVKAKAKGRKI